MWGVSYVELMFKTCSSRSSPEPGEERPQHTALLPVGKSKLAFETKNSYPQWSIGHVVSHLMFCPEAIIWETSQSISKIHGFGFGFGEGWNYNLGVCTSVLPHP